MSESDFEPCTWNKSQWWNHGRVRYTSRVGSWWSRMEGWPGVEREWKEVELSGQVKSSQERERQLSEWVRRPCLSRRNA